MCFIFEKLFSIFNPPPRVGKKFFIYFLLHFALFRVCVHLQDAKYPDFKTAEFRAIVNAVVESAPYEKQESWWKIQPKKLLDFEAAVKAGKKSKSDYNAESVKTGGGELCYLWNLLRPATPKTMEKLVEFGEKWERGEVATSRAKAINLVGKKNLTKSSRNLGKTKSAFVLQTVYKCMQGLEQDDQIELLDAAIHDVRSWDETKNVSFVFCSMSVGTQPSCHWECHDRCAVAISTCC